MKNLTAFIDEHDIMSSLLDILSEKLHLDKSTDEQPDLDNVKNIYIPTEPRDWDKMKEYKSKGSKPLTLVHTIKTRDKLLRRFAVAVKMGWGDAINTFADAIVDRGYYKREELDKYIATNK